MIATIKEILVKKLPKLQKKRVGRHPRYWIQRLQSSLLQSISLRLIRFDYDQFEHNFNGIKAAADCHLVENVNTQSPDR